LVEDLELGLGEILEFENLKATGNPPGVFASGGPLRPTLRALGRFAKPS
jgi:hypothetical protein